MSSRLHAALAAAWLAVAAGSASAHTADYEDRDNVEGPLLFLNAAPVRPLALDVNNDVWAVNTHNNTVERFRGGNPNPEDVFPVPWGPVSLAHYDDGPAGREVLVVCRNTWALARLDAVTGDILAVVELDSEPGDILVDATAERAFVSCMGGDSVLQIDLSQFGSQPARRYHLSTHPQFRCKSPLFLSFDLDGRVLVAPLHSGNNSTPAGAGTGPNVPVGQSVVDLENAQQGLPDEDLFAIDPDTGPLGTVTVVARHTGSVLFAHGIHPQKHELWQLHTEANNKDPQLQSEPLLRGRFAFNRITVLPTPFGSPSYGNPTTDVVELDPGGAFTPATTVAQPYALAFHPSNGKVFVAGMGSDNVVVMNDDRTFQKEWDLPKGSIPRGLILDPLGSVALVYCYGTGEIRAYRWGQNPPVGLVTYQLSHDPTPGDIAEGRRIFFDAANSEQKNLSCATCHIDGGSDLQVWNLSNAPKDDKGPMLTQTLVGLERIGPFHWRGERELVHFNGAFDGLLGNGAPLEEKPFAKLEAFLFSLRNPANPFQIRTRKIDPDVQFITELAGGGQPPPGNAVIGQINFRQDLVFDGRSRCNDCHAQPTGSNNDVFRDFPQHPVPPERSHLKVAPFHELWRRQQPIVDVHFNGSPSRRALLGAATGHSGLIPDVFHFTAAVPAGVFASNIAAFVHQWDQGLAPAVHYAFHLNAQSAPLAPVELAGYLEGEVLKRNCDLAVIGKVLVNQALVRAGWYYDRYDPLTPFVPDDPAIPRRSLADFVNAAAQESNTFIGLPVGMAERFAVDYDMDAQRNAVDAAPYVPGPLNAWDTTAPGLLAGPNVPWISTRAARLWLDANEPCTVTVRYQEPGLPQTERFVTSGFLGRTHALMLTGMRASTAMASTSGEFPVEPVAYDVDVTLRDRSGNVATVTLPAGTVTTDPFILPSELPLFLPGSNENDRQLLHEHVVRELALDVTELVPGTVRGHVEIDVAFKQGGGPPAEHRVVVGRVLRVPAGQHVATVHSDFTAGTGGIRVEDVLLSTGPGIAGCSGPYLVTTAVTDGAGHTVVEFDATNVAPGDTIQFNVEGVVEILDAKLAMFAANVAAVDCSPTGSCTLILPVQTIRSFSQWDFPVTGEANTCASAVY